jgi:hypothetical protein
MLPLFLAQPALVAPAPAQGSTAPAEIVALRRDYAEDLLCLFSWALDIKFTDAERARFIKERELEWESGNNNWQCQFIGHYWALLTLPKEAVDGNKDANKKEITDFIIANAKASQPDCIWIQKRLGDDEVNDLPISKARRAPLEKMRFDAAIDSMPLTFAGTTIQTELKVLDVANCLAKVSMMLQTPFTPEQRQEFVERAKKHWRKYRGDWGRNSTSPNQNPFSYVNNGANYFVYKYNLQHNEKEIRSFTERGERDSMWLMKIYDNAWHRTPLIASEPGLSRSIVCDYTRLQAARINEILGRKAVLADVSASIQMQKEIVAKWSTYSPAKRETILKAPSGLFNIYEVYPYCASLYQEHQKYLWGRDMVASIPQLKPVVDARAAEFAKIAKKNPNWKEDMDKANQEAINAYLQKNEEKHQRMMKIMDRMYDSMVFSNKMTALNNAILRAPSGSTVHIDIRP